MVLMSENNTYAKNRGLSKGTTAPEFSTRDAYNNKISLNDILKNNRGLLIDFFRGTW